MSEFSINARKLHKTLNVSTRFNDWVNRKIVKVFKEGVDYQVVEINVANQQTGRGGVLEGW
jgi:phage anti-repressor protein